MGEFAWNKEKHEANRPKDVVRITVACVCGSKVFSEVRQLVVVRSGTEAQLDTVLLAPMCIKCGKAVDVKALLTQVINEGKRPHIEPPPETSQNQ